MSHPQVPHQPGHPEVVSDSIIERVDEGAIEAAARGPEGATHGAGVAIAGLVELIDERIASHSPSVEEEGTRRIAREEAARAVAQANLAHGNVSVVYATAPPPPPVIQPVQEVILRREIVERRETVRSAFNWLAAVVGGVVGLVLGIIALVVLNTHEFVVNGTNGQVFHLDLGIDRTWPLEAIFVLLAVVAFGALAGAIWSRDEVVSVEQDRRVVDEHDA